GSSGGHKGVTSIIKALETQDFNRLKLGVGKSCSKEGTREYVLSGFSRREVKVLDSLLDKAAGACEAWARFGIDKAMNEFNQKKA
ncbi:MAG: aminoacyl-tRNA hydrolase, partial [Candidatus Omnitrophica bacterium]|nr:aminoacyl-tRNA hydrolase [Candidatus Omnitrophota bacterium]